MPHLLPLRGADSRARFGGAGRPSRTVNLREADVLESLNGWIDRLVDRDNVHRTVAALAEAITAAQELLATEGPLPADLRDALVLITSPGSAH